MFHNAKPGDAKTSSDLFLRYWIKGKGRLAIFPATQYTGSRVQVIIFFYVRWANQMNTFFSDEQTRWALFFRWANQMSTFFSDAQNHMSTIPQMSKARWAPLYLISKLRWAPCIFRWALFTYEMSTCLQCGCEDQLIFIFWLFLTIINLPLFK